ncbi:hypothetical protein [Solitalea koreensis]|uniref:Uncharacterized protein n=1 Tax=Solitalea koreensis TaxID=543615 RepID=A0A521E3W9_9SPHI|nr:hypothetical protein [Solitalea koreensis]SMO77860.1 hypothetical protein SAMN06265350_11039 [Solitalea koreensis]
MSINNKKMKAMQNLLKAHMNTCSSCQGQRTTYQLNELPEPHKARWKEFPMLIDLDYLLYCKSCDEVSAILK